MLTAYCKKCKADVEPGEVCPLCGNALSKNSLRIAWCRPHRPVCDWLCWNAPARIVLPVAALALLLVLVPEGILRGAEGLRQTLSGGLPAVLLGLLAAAALLLWLVLALQGDDLIDCVVDSRGIHLRTYLVDPTPLRLLLRLRSPARLSEAVGEPPVVLVAEQDVPWREIVRVQLWPQKLLVLLYSPYWWMRAAIPCDADVWDEVLAYMRDKVGRKKNLLLPPEIAVRKED